MQYQELLFELRTEEIPAAYIEPAIKQIKIDLLAILNKNLISVNSQTLDIFATCRRLIIIFEKFPVKQISTVEKLKGPPLDIALKNNKPTKALEGFLQKCEVENLNLLKKEIIKGKQYFTFDKKTGGGYSRDIVSGIFYNMIKMIKFPKKMKWANFEFYYPRPIIGILFMLGEELIPIEIAGVKSSLHSRGHFILANELFSIHSIKQFKDKLVENYVIYDEKERLKKIKILLADKARQLNLFPIENEQLLNTVNYLVEYPVLNVCKFDENFLDMPAMIAISEMQEHQKYFPLVDKEGNLSNTYFVISNMPSSNQIISGNQRVLKARLSDGRFFYDEDQKRPLTERVDDAKNIVYQKSLGSLYEKLQRMEIIAQDLGKILFNKLSTQLVKQCIFLLKTDLTSYVVTEFPHLQGAIGEFYAIKQNLPAEIATAIAEHYLPRFQGDILPESPLGILSSLSEKLENIIGNFSIDQKPTGSADPLALRRQAIAIVVMITKLKINFNIVECIHNWSKNYPNADNKLSEQVWLFLAVRAKTIFKDKGIRKDFINAAFDVKAGVNYGNINGIAHVLKYLDTSSSEQFEELMLSLKRMSNIIKSSGIENTAIINVDQSLLQQDEEISLFKSSVKLNKIAGNLSKYQHYKNCFDFVVSIKDQIDNFFDNVMVLSDKQKLKINRIALLTNIVRPFNELLNLTSIDSKKKSS